MGGGVNCETLSVILRQNREFRKTFKPKTLEVKGGRRKLGSEELHNPHSTPNILEIVKSWRM
jgi:hypothetical protein